MNRLRATLSRSPVLARAIPYILIVVLTFVQDADFTQKLFGPQFRYWCYFAKMLLGAWCIWEMRPLVKEMKWAFSGEAVIAGVAIWAVWVFLDSWYPKLEIFAKMGAPWNPFAQFGAGSALGWFFFCVRTLGSALIVPPLEEVFYRSFLYRYITRPDFENEPLNRFHLKSFIVVPVIFGLVHFQWLAGIVCGLTFQALVLKKNRLGDAMLAHAITNFLLGLWIYWKADWKFW